MARVTKRRGHESKNLDDHLVDKTKFVELGAKDAPVDNIQWEVQKAEVHADPIEDRGVGPKVVIRRFKFKLPPGLKETPSHEELLEWHKKNTVIPLLYKDELVLRGELRIIAGKKNSFTIVGICEPAVRFGMRSIIQDNATAVQEIINATSSPNPDKLH